MNILNTYNLSDHQFEDDESEMFCGVISDSTLQIFLPQALVHQSLHSPLIMARKWVIPMLRFLL